ncbi:MAG TPA: protein-glutamate O-methyltransferase CheR [Terriglobales bacterium]|nr:protein-glutamate O-methyltransferase CheR [Terriglobales bacterium]
MTTKLETVVPALTEHELDEMRTLIEKRAGLLFDQSRERFLTARVREHMIARKLAHGQDLLRMLKTSNLEYEALLEKLLTQETSFFRYPHVFEALEKKVLPEIHVKKFWENPRTLRLWCAGCATGEEAYSIAITLAEALDFTESWNLQILATDVSRRALEHAERGVYSRRALGELTPKQVEAHFAKVGDQFLIKPRIRNMVSFVPMNLVDGVYLRRFDAIFCMNVLIYFSDEQRVAVLQRFHDSLEPGGYMFLGHAESLAGAGVKFETIVHRDARLYLKPVNGSSRFASSVGVGEGLA